MKKLIFTLAITSSSVFAQIPTNGLIASYPFNGNANDESGNRNNGIVNGATLTTDRFGKANSAYSFDGVSNEILVAHNSVFNTFPISISVWFNTTVAKSGCMLVSKYGCQSLNGYSVHLNNGHPSAFYFSQSSGGYINKDNQNPYSLTVNDGSWHNITTVANTKKMYYYLDGNLLDSTSYIGTPDTTNTLENVHFGRYLQGNCGLQNFFYSGKIDDIKIYNRAISASEVTSIYNDDNTGMIAHYPFNGNAKDISGNGNHGIVNGATLTTDRFGKANSAYSFDGKSSFIKVPTIGSTAFNPDFSIELWVNIRDFKNAYPHIIQGENNFLALSTTGSAYTTAQQNKISFYTAYGNLPTNQQPITGTRLLPKNTIIPLNKWNQVVVSKMKDTIRYYYNGNIEYKGFYENKSLILGNYLLIGSANNSQSDYTLNGDIDDIKIYTKSLSTSEITALYNENKCFETVSVTDTLRISSIAGINSLPENFGSIKVYPNPAHDILNISISKPSTDYNIKIADNTGKTVYTSAMTSNNLQINLNQFTAKGLYFIQILDNSNKILDVRKLIVE